MNTFYQDIFEQPQALQHLLEYYLQGEGTEGLAAISNDGSPIFTGMGASFHAAWVTALYLHSLGHTALHLEASDLLNYSVAICNNNIQLVYISQSGASAEVAPILNNLLSSVRLVAITNEAHSPLARRAQLTLPLLVESEVGVASKTYLNSLAILWLLARRWGGVWNGREFDLLARVVDEIQQLLEQAGDIAACWLDAIGQVETLLFVGHGPHAATARQAAMMLGEWAKFAAPSASVGAFRHGFIESAGPEMGVVLFAAPGRTQQSSLTLAAELQEYGVRVLVVESGHTRSISAPSRQKSLSDEFLSPLLDIIPAQLFAEALRQQRGISPEFRYIAKVVTQL